MEDTLRVGYYILDCDLHIVLILVLMEDTLRVSGAKYPHSEHRLNPCFNGRYS